MDAAQLNWPAVVAGTVAAFALGMLWFGPRLFGRAWAQGSHAITPPVSAPVAAMVLTVAGLFLLALVVGMTETNQAIGTAVLAILAVAVTIAGMDLFSQKSGRATLIDAGYILASGVLMIAAQAIL
jgi:hypothetical protein